jgi:hypothetical protein
LQNASSWRVDGAMNGIGMPGAFRSAVRIMLLGSGVGIDRNLADSSRLRLAVVTILRSTGGSEQILY